MAPSKGKRPNTISPSLIKVKAYKSKIITQLVPYTAFYKAEDYHQNYFALHGSQPCCKYVIQPELDKFKAVFKDKLKN